MKGSVTDVILFGIGKTAERILKMLRKEVRVLAFADNFNAGSVFHGKKVIAPSELQEYCFSYLLIASVYGSDIEKQLLLLGIPAHKIIRMIPDKKGGKTALFEYHYLIHNPFEERLNAFLQSTAAQTHSKPTEYETIITGISYHNDGIDAATFSRPAFNFALRGQDIFYDEQVVRYLLKHHAEQLQKLRYAIVGLSYYSFEYDFSKSGSAVEAMRYYPRIREAHNFADDGCLESIWQLLSQDLEKYREAYPLFDFDMVYELNEEEGQKAAEADQNKNFPFTVCENICLLNRYFSLLEMHHVIPIVVIMPATDYYSKYYRKENIRAFYQNLKTAVGGRSIQILDYFSRPELADCYWYHVTHLNPEGAKRFTAKLEKDILW